MPVIVVTRTDDHVSVITLIPIGAVRLSDNRPFVVDGSFSSEGGVYKFPMRYEEFHPAKIETPHTDDPMDNFAETAIERPLQYFVETGILSLVGDFDNPPPGWKLLFRDEAVEIETFRAVHRDPEDATKEVYVSHRSMPTSALPSDMTFFNAWQDVTPDLKIDINMPKARDIWRDAMRAARGPKLASLDVDFQRALEDGSPTKNIVARKKALRDVTKHPDIEAAATTDDLKKVWPDALKD